MAKASVNGAGKGEYAFRVSARQKDEELSVRYVLDLVLKGKWMILGTFVLMVGIATVYTLLSEPGYETTSVLYVNNQQSGPQLSDLLGIEGSGRNVLNEIEILKSRTIAGRVAKQLLALGRIPGTNTPLPILEAPEGKPPLDEDDIIHRLSKDYVSVHPAGRDVDLIRVVVTSPDPREAELIANLYADTFVEFNRTSSRARMTASREFLDEVSEHYNEELRRAEQDVAAYLSQERIVVPEEEAKQLLQLVSDLQRLRYETSLELGVARAELRGLENEVNRIMPGLADRLASGEDLVADRLKEAIATLQLEKQRLYARNPALRDAEVPQGRVAEIDAEIASLAAELDQHVAQVVQGTLEEGGLLMPGMAEIQIDPRGGISSKLAQVQALRGQLTMATIKVSNLEAGIEIVDQELASYMARLQELPSKTIIMRRLERAQEIQEEIYLTVLEKMQEARIAEQSELGYIEIIDRAFLPEEPVRPRPALNLVLGGVLGLMLGIGLALLRGSLDNKIHGPEDLRKHGFTVVGVIPDMQRVLRSDFGGKSYITVEGRRYDTRLMTLLNPMTPISESYRRLRTNIQFSRPDVTVQAILVTSSSPGEGKSITAMNLAVTMAQAGRRTVYVDADLRRPTGHHMMGLSREPGLSDVLFDSERADFQRFTTDVDDLYVIPAGASVPNPAEMLGSKRMRDLIARLREEFDVVVIDTPPVLAVTDAMLVSPQCDAVVLVCTADETTWQMLERADETLRDVGTSITGVVLNRYTPKAADASYGYGYYEYYGADVQQKQEA